MLKRDGNYRRAYIGVASALLRKGDYKGAMKYAKLADAPAIYNRAFEGYRMEFLKKNFAKMFAVVAALIVVLFVTGRKRKKKRLAEAAALAEQLARDEADRKKKEEG